MTPAAQASAPPSDRRIAPRRQPTFGTVCRLDPQPGDGPPAVGLVWNISESGVSMLVAEPRPAGTILAGELTVEAGGPGLPVTLKVVHVRPVPTGDYIIGAQFSRPLAPDEMRPFLGPAGRDDRSG